MTKFLTLVPLLAGSLAASAHAQDLSVSVGYGDLDLSGPAGVTQLDHRIDAAIRQVCGDSFGQKAMSETMSIRRCSRETRSDVASPRQIAIARARGQLPSVELAAARSGSASALLVRRR